MSQEQEKFQKGEAIAPSWTYRFIDLSEIPAGSKIAPAKIDTEGGKRYAALNQIASDLSYARECLSQADTIGVPSVSDIQSRALIFSGVVAYARPFKTGVRQIRLTTEFFSSLGKLFDSSIHNYLISVRDKHIAHSVNEFETGDATAVVVQVPGGPDWSCRGIGYIGNVVIGLNREIVRGSVVQIDAMLEYLKSKIQIDGDALYLEYKETFDKDHKWDMAPLVRFPDRNNVANKRKT